MRIRLGVGLALGLCFASTIFAQPLKKPLSAAGRVNSVGQDSITILVGADKMMLVVDGATKVTGKGLGTETRNMKAEGREGRLRATEINVRLVKK